MVINEITGHDAVREYGMNGQAARSVRRGAVSVKIPANDASHTDGAVKVDLHVTQAVDGSRPKSPANDKAYDYDVTEDNRLVVKVVDRENRSEVVRQYPSEQELELKEAYRRFMELLGL